jgi:malate synthase
MSPATATPPERVQIGSLRVDAGLHALVEREIAPGTGVDPSAVWRVLDEMVRELGPTNRALLEKRDELQRELDAWWQARRGRPLDLAAERAFLEEIGYLVPEGPPFRITTENVDPEVAAVSGPQLVVPVDNARYALNAANARWGSLYDALYGTDVIPEDGGCERGMAYNPTRGAKVIRWAMAFLDEAAPLEGARYEDVVGYRLEDGRGKARLAVDLAGGRSARLADETRFAGYRLRADGGLGAVLLRNHGLHIEIAIDPGHPVGAAHPAGVSDVVLESAVTTIQDLEDSVAAVDAQDKIVVYRNWLGIMKGELAAIFVKAGEKLVRRLSPDRMYQGPDGGAITLPGRSLLLVRNVGIHMYTDAVTTASGEQIPEGFLDAAITVYAALHDLKRTKGPKNSRAGSVYVVKPKLHGPEEVALTVRVFERVERAFGLSPCTVKIGIMDEERRTTVNLGECIRSARDRVIFINTGFLDRTGDEIHSCMEAGPVIPKQEIRSAPWMLAYEDWNVDTGIAEGLPGKAQIGKGMWAIPDRMKAMLEAKGAHPAAGASTAWVPSPTAATLHAIHYHRVNVPEVQAKLASRSRASLDDILTPPLLGDRKLSREEIQRELDNNIQGILGYVARWIGQGIGCSKVPDIHDVGLMEDRATLRISSQHIASWLHHGIVSRAQVLEAFERMAGVVDRQNAGDPAYHPLAPDLATSPEYQAALDLVFQGREQPNGYTEPILHARRREAKVARAKS